MVGWISGMLEILVAPRDYIAQLKQSYEPIALNSVFFPSLRLRENRSFICSKKKKKKRKREIFKFCSSKLQITVAYLQFVLQNGLTITHFFQATCDVGYTLPLLLLKNVFEIKLFLIFIDELLQCSDIL